MWEGMEVTVLVKMVSWGLTRMMTFEQRPGRGKGSSHVGKFKESGKALERQPSGDCRNV